MKVLLVHNHYQQFGGEDAIVELERKALAERGVEICVYSRHNDDIESFEPWRKALLPIGAIHSSRTVSGIRKALASFRPDVAYLHNIYPLISPSVYSSLAEAGVKSVQVAHNFRPFCLNGLLYTNCAICEQCLGASTWPGVVNRCFRGSLGLSAMYAVSTARARKAKVDGFICPTPFTAEKLASAGIKRERLYVRPHFLGASARPSAEGRGRHALYMGRLSAEKGLRTLLDSFARTPEVQLVVAGTGPLEDELRRDIARRGLDNVHLAGFVVGERKRELIEEAAFMVVPSECYEAFGMNVLEAFSAAKPVIASRIGGLPYVVEERRTGFLFEAGDAGALAARVRELAVDESLRTAMGRAARAAVESEYSEDRWFERTMEIFQAVRRGVSSPSAPAMAECAS